MKSAALGRQGGRRYASCLAGCAAAPSAKRCTPPLASWSSKRNSHRIASWETTSAISNRGDFSGSSCRDSSHRAFAPKLPSRSQRFFSAVTTYSAPSHSIDNTPLDSLEGAALLQGLDVHTVHAEDDGHPLAVYTIEENEESDTHEQQQQRIPVLLLHGRTWSSTTVYHLAGGNNNSTCEGGENRSLLQALYDKHNVQPYAVDFRGFGGTPKDESGFVEPLRCVSDAVSVLNWIHEKHSSEGGGGGGGDSIRPALLGWSHGALIAQITAQRHADALSKLILYGSIYNPNVKYSTPADPPEDLWTGHTDHDDFPVHEMTSRNEYDGATEDFTNDVDCGGCRVFADAALVSDPIKVQWWNLHQLNECHPSLVRVPTMVIAGDQDPYAPMQTQAELFTHLGRGVDRVWSIIANADHAVHLSDERQRFVENVNNFLETRS